MTDGRHGAYAEAKEILLTLRDDIGGTEGDLLAETIGHLFLTDDASEALAAFAAAEDQIEALARTGQLHESTARNLLFAIASAGPDPLAA
jgi:hypothetical protein